jgi:hypothetical protein
MIMRERHLTVRRQAAASRASIWAVLADFPNLAEVWNGIRASQAVGDRAEGLGARRRIFLSPVGTMIETVTTWEAEHALATANKPSVLVPFKLANSRLLLEPDGEGTAMTFDYSYVPRGGPIGRLTGPLIDRMLTATFESMLSAVEKAAFHSR